MPLWIIALCFVVFLCRGFYSSLTVLGTLYLESCRLFKPMCTNFDWLCTIVPTAATFKLCYSALIPHLLGDVSLSLFEHVLVVGMLVWFAGMAVFLRCLEVAPSKAAESKWRRCHLGVAALVSIGVGFAVSLMKASSAVDGEAYQGHSFVYNLLPLSTAVFGDEVDQGPPAVEYLGPFLVLSLTVLGALWCVDPRHFRHHAQIKWSDVSFRAFLPALASYVIYYFALMPCLFADASHKSI